MVRKGRFSRANWGRWSVCNQIDIFVTILKYLLIRYSFCIIGSMESAIYLPAHFCTRTSAGCTRRSAGGEVEVEVEVDMACKRSERSRARLAKFG